MAEQLRSVNALFGTASVVITPRASLNDYGEGVDGSPVTYTEARIEGKIQQVRTATGEERTSVKEIHINGAAAVSPDDKITLPGDATVWLVLAVRVIHFGSETVTTVVYL